MRTSIESRILNVLLVALFVLGGGRGVLATFTWSDCGDKLSSVFAYQSATVSPDPILAGSPILINVAFTISQNLIWTGNVLEVYYNGQFVLDVNTTDVCDISPTTLTCPFTPGTISYTDSYRVPLLPSGSYTFRIRNLFGMGTFQHQIGCLEIGVQIVNTESQSCTYTSTATALVTLPATFPKTENNWDQKTIGDPVIIGQAWGTESINAPWGTFSSVTASPDIFLLSNSFSSPGDLFWAASGNLYNISSAAGGSVNFRYSGVFFIGYNGTTYPKLLTYDNSVLSGTFDWTFNIAKTGDEAGLTGTFQIDPALGNQPTGWPYPLGFGRLNNFSMSQQSSQYSITSTKTYDSCVVLATPPPNNLIPGGTTTTSQYTNDQKVAIGLGVAGFLLVIGIIVLLFVAWRQNKYMGRLNDDDLVDPLKPDYGSLAINDIIEDAEDLPR